MELQRSKTFTEIQVKRENRSRKVSLPASQFFTSNEVTNSYISSKLRTKLPSLAKDSTNHLSYSRYSRNVISLEFRHGQPKKDAAFRKNNLSIENIDKVKEDKFTAAVKGNIYPNSVKSTRKLSLGEYYVTPNNINLENNYSGSHSLKERMWRNSFAVPENSRKLRYDYRKRSLPILHKRAEDKKAIIEETPSSTPTVCLSVKSSPEFETILLNFREEKPGLNI